MSGEEEEEEEMSVPPSPTPAVALFPGEGVGAVAVPPPRVSPPATPQSLPSVPGFMALEMALSSSSAPCGDDELDLQLFRRDGVVVSSTPAGGAALRFPCGVCGKRFRFQSILSLHARAHRLDRERRATVLYHAGQDTRKPRQELDQPRSSQEGSLVQNLECTVDQNLKQSLERNLDESLVGSSDALTLENSPDQRMSRSRRSLDGGLEQNLDHGVDQSINKSPDQSLDSSPRKTIQPAFSPRFPDPFQSPSLTPPPTKEAPITAAFTPLLPSHSEDPAQTMGIAAVATTSFRCNECKGKFRTA